MADDFFFQREAGLPHAGSHEVGGEGGEIIGNSLGESGGQRAARRVKRAGHERIGIVGEDLSVVVVRIVEKKAGVGDAVFGLDDRVVDLRDADEEEAVSGADNEGASVAEGVSESGARREVVGFEGNFAGGWKQRIGEQSGSGERLQVPADSEIERQVVGDADGVLRKAAYSLVSGCEAALPKFCK